MLQGCSLLNLTLALTLLVVQGCSVPVPGSMGGFIAVNGQVVDSKGTPISGETLRVVVPGGYGLTASERAQVTPELIRWIESFQTLPTQTDQGGAFVAFITFVYHVDVWISRDGEQRAYPEHPPPPVLVVGFSEKPRDVYILDLTVQPLRYRVVQHDSGRELVLDQAQWRLTQATAKMDRKDNRNGWSVTITFQRTN